MGNHPLFAFRRLVIVSVGTGLAALYSHGNAAAAGPPVLAGKALRPNLLSMSAPLSPVKSAEMQLRQMGEAIHRIKSASVDLIRECQQENEMMGGEIDFIGTDVIPIMPATAEGFGPPQYLPPRKKYVDLHMSQLTQLIPILQSDIDSLTLADPDEKTRATPALTSIGALMKDIGAQMTSLKSLTVSPPYDNAAIVNEATLVHQDTCQVDKLRKDVYSIVRKDPDKGVGK